MKSSKNPSAQNPIVATAATMDSLFHSTSEKISVGKRNINPPIVGVPLLLACCVTYPSTVCFALSFDMILITSGAIKHANITEHTK